jgi:hypothetical protein
MTLRRLSKTTSTSGACAVVREVRRRNGDYATVGGAPLRSGDACPFGCAHAHAARARTPPIFVGERARGGV